MSSTSIPEALAGSLVGLRVGSNLNAFTVLDSAPWKHTGRVRVCPPHWRAGFQKEGTKSCRLVSPAPA